MNLHLQPTQFEIAEMKERLRERRALFDGATYDRHLFADLMHMMRRMTPAQEEVNHDRNACPPNGHIAAEEYHARSD
ncbi:hypothetical protein [Paracoccus sp. (in: a-proteobacteria)]|uniref:hypothetical protein n=1 Tax=Paracoccus sp. TaxID=267 RepID=UPI00396C9912